jgi:hypothetical protein
MLYRIQNGESVMETVIRKLNDISMKILIALFAMLLILAFVAKAPAGMQQDNKSATEQKPTIQPVAAAQIPKTQLAPVQRQQTKELKDPEIQKIEQALNAVKQQKANALNIVNQIQVSVTQTLSMLDACPVMDSGYVVGGAPISEGVCGLSELYNSIGSCTDYSINAQVVIDNSNIHFNCLKSLLSDLNLKRNYVYSNCKSLGLSSSLQEEIRNSLSSLTIVTQKEIGVFDKYIQDINKLLEDYLKCKNKPKNMGTSEGS